jgi:hypothetical protein
MSDISGKDPNDGYQTLYIISEILNIKATKLKKINKSLDKLLFSCDNKLSISFEMLLIKGLYAIRRKNLL